ncbi:MAG: class I SAM-dependent methyltransferase [Oscillospiraceae bacterium]|jgi:tRNA A22 N-methylase|nr:class I SAM-dependent methyltransferase [Oscillospiraceae bacterium]
MLSARLAAVTDYMPRREAAADVGADHGWASARLLEENRCGLVYVTDISDKALSRAEANLTRMGLTSRACFICCDGINALAAREPKPGAVMIAGMGARTIVNILDSGHDALAALGWPVLSLSPNRDPELLRLWLAGHGYALARERVVRSAGRWYPALCAERVGGAAIAIDPRALYLGLTASPPLTDDARAYWQWRLGALKARLPGGDKYDGGVFGALAQRIGWVEGALGRQERDSPYN